MGITKSSLSSWTKWALDSFYHNETLSFAINSLDFIKNKKFEMNTDFNNIKKNYTSNYNTGKPRFPVLKIRFPLIEIN